MCGRYAIFAEPSKLKDMFGTENILNIEPRYNAAPMQDMPIIIKTRMGMARWGLLPPWAKSDDASLAVKMINARSETVHEKPSFRDSWEKRRRCLIPVSGFYEWKKSADAKTKTPYFIHDRDDDVLALAGLWSKWGDDVVTYTILTKQADGPIADLHHRMPVIVPASQSEEWFGADTAQAHQMMADASGASLTFHAVSNQVGAVKNDYKELVDAVAA